MYLTMWDIIFYLNNLGIFYNLHFEVAQSLLYIYNLKKKAYEVSENENTNSIV